MPRHTYVCLDDVTDPALVSSATCILMPWICAICWMVWRRRIPPAVRGVIHHQMILATLKCCEYGNGILEAYFMTWWTKKILIARWKSIYIFIHIYYHLLPSPPTTIFRTIQQHLHSLVLWILGLLLTVGTACFLQVFCTIPFLSFHPSINHWPFAAKVIIIYSLQGIGQATFEDAFKKQNDYGLLSMDIDWIIRNCSGWFISSIIFAYKLSSSQSPLNSHTSNSALSNHKA